MSGRGMDGAWHGTDGLEQPASHSAGQAPPSCLRGRASFDCRTTCPKRCTIALPPSSNHCRLPKAAAPQQPTGGIQLSEQAAPAPRKAACC